MIISSKRNPEQAQTSNRILIGTEIKGDITSTGDFRIDGKHVGNITITGKLVIGEKGEVTGDVSCSNVNVAGLFRGKAVVKELATLAVTAKFEGELHTGKLSIEPGAEFTGSCNMGAVVRNMKDERPGEKTA